MESIQNILDRILPSLEQACSHPNGLSGQPTGYEALDKLTSGWQKGELIVIAAPERMGKTALALSMLSNTMYDDGLGTFWFSTNLSALQLTKMMICNNLKVTMRDLQSGKVNMETLDEMYEKYKFSGVHFDDSPYLTIDDIDSILTERFDNYPIELVVIDNVNQLNYIESKSLNLSDKFYQLKTLARKYEIPIIVLMETGNQQKEVSGYYNNWLSLTDYAPLLKSVDISIHLYRPEYYKITEFSDKSSTLGIAELILSGRTGPGTIRLKYKPVFYKII